MVLQMRSRPTVVTIVCACTNRWAAVPQSDWPMAPAQRDIIMQDFDPADKAIGDRRQVQTGEMQTGCTNKLKALAEQLARSTS